MDEVKEGRGGDDECTLHLCLQLNDVRSSLASLAPISTGYSLVQPHLERTRLCDLPDSQLSPVYVRYVLAKA